MKTQNSKAISLSHIIYYCRLHNTTTNSNFKTLFGKIKKKYLFVMVISFILKKLKIIF